MNYFTFVLANTFRNRLRAFLTLASLTVAFLIFGLLQPIIQGVNNDSELLESTRLMVAPKYSLNDPLRLRYESQIEQVPGVEIVSKATWFSGVYKDPENFFPRYGVDTDEILKIHDEYVLPEDQAEAFNSIRTATIIGRATAEKYNLSIGDKISLIPDYWPNKDGVAWEFDLVGIFDHRDPAAEAPIEMYFNHDYFNEYRSFGQGYVDSYVVTISDPSRAGEISAAIDELFANDSLPTKTATEQSYTNNFLQQIGDLTFLVGGVLLAVMFTILLLTANTISQGLRERISELGVLKTLGFYDFSIFLIILSEAVVLVFTGAALGLAISLLLIGYGDSVALQFSYLFDVSFQPLTLVYGFIIAFFIALLIGVPIGVRASKLDIVSSLRH